jgi:hypothetical protein
MVRDRTVETRASHVRDRSRILRAALLGLATGALGATTASASLDSGSWSFATGGCALRKSDTKTCFQLSYTTVEISSGIRPLLGGLSSTEGDVFLFGGLRGDLRLGERWGLSPVLTCGHYNRGGGIDLGGEFAFREGLEFSYRTSERTHLALGLYHISNAGIYDRNPGRESILFSYTITP